MRVSHNLWVSVCLLVNLWVPLCTSVFVLCIFNYFAFSDCTAEVRYAHGSFCFCDVDGIFKLQVLCYDVAVALLGTVDNAWICDWPFWNYHTIPVMRRPRYKVILRLVMAISELPSLLHVP